MLVLPRIDWQPLNPAAAPATKRVPAEKKPPGGFQGVLNEKIAGLKFSRHASERLQTRRINLTAEQMLRLEQGVMKAAGKGARESLVLLDDLAMVVSIRNRTVVTASVRHELRENIFTNIDSAVLL